MVKRHHRVTVTDTPLRPAGEVAQQLDDALAAAGFALKQSLIAMDILDDGTRMPVVIPPALTLAQANAVAEIFSEVRRW